MELIRNERQSLGGDVNDLHPGTLLESLSPSELQTLAVYRSRKLDVSKWVDRLRTY